MNPPGGGGRDDTRDHGAKPASPVIALPADTGAEGATHVLAPRSPAHAGPAPLIEGSIPAAVFKLAWPVAISMGLHTAFHVVNLMWIGRLGASALAAVSTAYFATWLIYALTDLVSFGVTAFVSRRIGERRPELAGEATAHALGIALVLYVLVATTWLLGATPLFRVLGTAPEVGHEGIRYLRLFAAGSLPAFIAFTLEASLRASGDTRTPMRVMLMAVGLNIVLDPLLIFGIGPLPRLGVAGAVLATVISMTLAAVTLVRYFASPRRPFAIPWRRVLESDRALVLSIVRVGAPPAFAGALFSVVYLFLSAFAARMGTVTVAALGIGNRLESLTFLTAGGFEVAASTLVGQALGAGIPRRAERSAWTAAGLMACCATLIGVAMLLASRPLASLFTDDPEVVEETVRFLRILAPCQIFMGIEIPLMGAFTGAGNTMPPTLISVPISILRIPMAWVLSQTLGWGPAGIWWTVSTTCCLRGALMAWWFRRNRWMRGRI